jgi:hypothetical protein
MPVPFERARTLLIYGRVLRRAKRRKAAREAIDAALAVVEELPAPVWVDNARAELARIGGRVASGSGLTEAERRFADLVAEGKTNKKVASLGDASSRASNAGEGRRQRARRWAVAPDSSSAYAPARDDSGKLGGGCRGFRGGGRRTPGLR